MIGTLNEHVQAIMNNKDLLIDRLQRPYVGKYIKMEAAYHKYVLVFVLLKFCLKILVPWLCHTFGCTVSQLNS